MGTEKNLANTVKGDISTDAGDADVWTLIFEMDPEANDDYQNSKIEGISFVLNAVQAAKTAGT